jgi:hypothetical protein
LLAASTAEEDPRVKIQVAVDKYGIPLHFPSDGPLRFHPCASLVLHLHQVAQGTFTLQTAGHAQRTGGPSAPHLPHTITFRTETWPPPASGFRAPV